MMSWTGWQRGDDISADLMQKIEAVRQQQAIGDAGLQLELARYVLAKLAITSPRYHDSRPAPLKLAGTAQAR